MGLPKIITEDRIAELVAANSGLCVSIYMPTHKAGREIGQDPIRLKNLLTKAEEELCELGANTKQIRSIIQPAKDLCNDTDFWRHQETTLCLLLNEESHSVYRLPLDLPELLITSVRFHIKPLFALFPLQRVFHVLAASQTSLRLFEGNAFGLEELEVSGLPAGFAEIIAFDEIGKQRQLHSASSGTTGFRTAIHHGQFGGVGDSQKKRKLIEYFQKADRAVAAKLNARKTPLVFFGVQNLYGLYKEVNSYPLLLEEFASGAPDQLTLTEIHQEAWRIVSSYFNEQEQKAYQRLNSLSGSKESSLDVERSVVGAMMGQVAEVFVPADHEAWGKIKEGLQLQLNEEHDKGDLDLLDLAAVETHLKGGVVHTFVAGEHPELMPLATIFRYPAA